MTKQIFPSTIMGSSFAEGGSVLDHNFGAGEPYTLGVEEEYMLLDGETLDLVQHIEAVLAATEGHELEPQVNAAQDVADPGLGGQVTDLARQRQRGPC